ncbi:proton myo-inositol cotransporter isoform X1 [Hydra vulgaris]|uniref:proton myo-inositol cotransporter isoform X1 n=1 Tax=Hydra vulgaris TaxID=6087 RepID=UPI001F5EDC91|nr:proton myo-inositol cotransporter [Hydra vulgaris]
MLKALCDILKMDKNPENKDSLVSDDTSNEYSIEKSPLLNVEKRLPLECYQKSSCYLYFLTIFTAIGGFLFGYDTGVISGAMIPLKKQFDLTNLMQEAIVSMALVGAIIGSLVSGILNNYYGRRPSMITGGFLFTIGSVCMGVANGPVLILVGRLFVGFGIGLVSMAVPLYIAEAAPSNMRGKLVTINVLFITFGQFFASLLNGAFSHIKKDSWRYMLGAAAFPSFVLFVGFFWMPESPRWLLNEGFAEKARKVLIRLRGTNNVDEEFNQLAEMLQATQKKNGSIKDILRLKHTRRALAIGCALQAFQQLCGINTVMYYSATIIELAGVEDEHTIIWLAAVVAAGNFVFTILSIMLIEHVGRRKLTLVSIFGVSAALLLLAFMFWKLEHESWKITYMVQPLDEICSTQKTCQSCLNDEKCGFCYIADGNQVLHASCLPFGNNKGVSPLCDQKYYSNVTSSVPKWSGICPTAYPWFPVLAMTFYLAMFAPGMGSMPWCINAEIYPIWARSTGNSISTATNWVLNLLVSLTFLNLMDWLTRFGAFLFYSSVAFVGFWVFYLFLPETKSRNLEDIDSLFKGSLFIPCKKKI